MGVKFIFQTGIILLLKKLKDPTMKSCKDIISLQTQSINTM